MVLWPRLLSTFFLVFFYSDIRYCVVDVLNLFDDDLWACRAIGENGPDYGAACFHVDKDSPASHTAEVMIKWDKVRWRTFNDVYDIACF
ncbi:hypothetical protein BVG81_004120 [Haliangium sp. UPWRP_2]|nr:hypothetical protein BVG81_004120 [Haliangium sp. UPWRP_2]